MAIPTNQVKKETTTQPQTSAAGPAYSKLDPYNGVMPVNNVIVENEIASVLNNVYIHWFHKFSSSNHSDFMKHVSKDWIFIKGIEGIPSLAGALACIRAHWAASRRNPWRRLDWDPKSSGIGRSFKSSQGTRANTKTSAPENAGMKKVGRLHVQSF